jgi:hypothetical protein
MSGTPNRIWAVQHPLGVIEAFDCKGEGRKGFVSEDIHEARIQELEMALDVRTQICRQLGEIRKGLEADIKARALHQMELEGRLEVAESKSGRAGGRLWFARQD